MISLILPYWERQAATDAALSQMAFHYRNLDLEVIIVDDGTIRPFRMPDGMPFKVKLVRLPEKSMPLNPCVPINRGVEASTGDYIALSNPEIMHKKPILAEMRDEAQKNGPNAYVMAAAWCPEQMRWHRHSSMKRENGNDVGAWLPEGANYHFMSLMSRQLWDKTGGFDEDYRQGHGYDDPDFVRRLYRAGAKFIMRDDLVVTHPRTDARAKWLTESMIRNRALFMTKWEPLRELACLA